MRRAVAAFLVLATVLVAGTTGASGSSAAATVVRHRPAKVKCRDVRGRATDVLAGDSTGSVLLPGRLTVLRRQLASLGQHKRRDLLHVLASAAVVMCRQKRHGVPWTAAATHVYRVGFESMLPALAIGDHIVLNGHGYDVADPKRREIVVHDIPGAGALSPSTQGIRRIVGLPGETIEGRDGRIWIDGQPLPEPYLPKRVESRTFGPEQIPAGSYYLLGDNRQYSKDSTFYGPVAGEHILGPATLL